MAEVGVISSCELTELAPSDYSSREGKLSQDHQGCPSAFVCSSPAEWTRVKDVRHLCFSQPSAEVPVNELTAELESTPGKLFRFADTGPTVVPCVRCMLLLPARHQNRCYLQREQSPIRTIFDVARDPRSASMRTHLVHC